MTVANVEFVVEAQRNFVERKNWLILIDPDPITTSATATQFDLYFPHISLEAHVCGREACIRKTRIAVWVLEKWRRLGCSDQQILAMYPDLNGEQLKAAWSYVESHKAEIDKLISENEDD